MVWGTYACAIAGQVGKVDWIGREKFEDQN